MEQIKKRGPQSEQGKADARAQERKEKADANLIHKSLISNTRLHHGNTI